MASPNILQLHGIVPPMVTPLTEDMDLDSEAVYRLVKHLKNGGVHGIFVLGTTGEAPSLTDSVKEKLLQVFCQEVGSELPWLVGITDNCLENAIEWARRAAKYGATAVVAASPFYFPVNQAALYDFFLTLAQASPLPLYLYDIPSHTRNRLERDTIIALARIPNIVGYKDSSGELMHFHWLHQQIRPFPYFLGPEEFLLETTLLGASGGVNGGANVFPKLYVQLYKAAKESNLETARSLHQLVMQLSLHLYQNGRTVTSGIKFALSERGIGNGIVAPPQSNLTEEEKGRMRAFLLTFEKMLDDNDIDL